MSRDLSSTRSPRALAKRRSAGPQTIRKILVASDFSEHAAAALGRAVWLAERSGASITVAHVITGVAYAAPATSYAPHLGPEPAELRKAERKLRVQAEERLHQILAPYDKLGRRLNIATPTGVPFIELIRLAQQGEYNLVLAGTRGRSTIKRFLLGSTAERLLRKSPCPVWVVRSAHEWPLRSILVPVDYSAASARSISVAACLARLAECPVTVLHVFDSEMPAIPFSEAGVEPGFNNWRREMRHAASECLNDFVAEHVPADIESRQQLGVGSPWQVIARVASRIDAGLIVMGSVGRSGIPGFLIGNTAEKVLRSCDRSILAVKPENFVCPVRAKG